MYSKNILKNLLLPPFLCMLVVNQASTSEGLEPELILNLKKGHLNTCIPNISRQLQSLGLPVSQGKAELYCECLGNIYYNDLTKREFAEIKQRTDGVPSRIAKERRAIQEYCWDVHF